MIFRALRAFKLVGKWDELRKTMYFLWTTKDDIINFAVLVALFIFIFAVIGMELFAGEIKFNAEDEKDLLHGESPRVINFDSFGYALLSAFTLQIGDNWSIYYVVYMRWKPVEATFYFLFAVIVLNIILMGLFLGIILQNFFSDDQKQEITEEDKRNREFHERQKKLTKKSSAYRSRIRTLLAALKFFKIILSDMRKEAQVDEDEMSKKPFGISLSIFPSTSTIRCWIFKVVKHYAFDLTMCVVTAINSVALTFYTPLTDPNGSTYKRAHIVDIVTTVFFCIEVAMKAVAYGALFNGPYSYLRNPLNVLDFVASIMSVITLSWSSTTSSAAKVFLLFRILRALRFTVIYRDFRLRLMALLKGLPKIIQMLLMVLLFIVVFGVVGVQYFQGMFYYCDRTQMEEAEVEVITAFDCMDLGGEWRARNIGFDNILSAGMTLFEIFSGKSWCNTITFLSDLVGIDYEPVRDISFRNVWFGVIYSIILIIFVRAVLTGVISNTFFVYNSRLQGLHELTNMQRRWVSLSKIIFKASPIKTVSNF